MRLLLLMLGLSNGLHWLELAPRNAAYFNVWVDEGGWSESAGVLHPEPCCPQWLSVPNGEWVRISGAAWFETHLVAMRVVWSPTDFDVRGDAGTDEDIAAFWECIATPGCKWDFNRDGEHTDADIECFYQALAGQACPSDCLRTTGCR